MAFTHALSIYATINRFKALVKKWRVEQNYGHYTTGYLRC